MNASLNQSARLWKLPFDGQQRRVLVVDDNVFDQELTVRLLQQSWPFESGLVVDRAGDGREALTRLDAASYALVVLDWNMPVMDGRAVLHTMRARSLGTPVIVLSGQWHDEIGICLESLGACFLNKDSVDRHALHRAIAAALVLSQGWESAQHGAPLSATHAQ